MKNLLKKIAIPALLVLSLAQSGVLVKQALDDRKLDQSKFSDVSQQNPACLAEKSGGSAYIVMESDEQAKVYRGVRILLMFGLPLEISFRELNSRNDLVQVDCKTGQPLSN